MYTLNEALLQEYASKPIKSSNFNKLIGLIYDNIADICYKLPIHTHTTNIEFITKRGKEDYLWGLMSAVTKNDDKVRLSKDDPSSDYLGAQIDTTTLEVSAGKIRRKGGAPTFLSLTDTPSSYSGASGKYVKISSTGASVEFASIDTLPIGSIVMWTSLPIPSGWYLCDGNTHYLGSSNETKSPNLSNRFVVIQGTDFPVMTSGGASTCTLSASNLPEHTHTANIQQIFTGNHCSGTGLSAYTTKVRTSVQPEYTGATAATMITLPPYYALFFIIKGV